mmetsp:Transcript_15129/g.19940  ORF Transcript_15129/g.19940 Transcript_15129/m.19940 type:complete len:166 (+) Transcript_15129:131-628(+)
MSSAAEWDNEYARLARAASQMRTRGFSSDVQSKQALQAGLARLDSQLNQLPLSGNEVDRRRRLIQHLQSSSSMQSAMQQQDDMIDELALGVGRLKNQTQLIGDEAKMHVNLLNDMEDHIDVAQEGLDMETRRAAQLKENSSLWKLYMIIAGLSMLLILLILTGLS